MLKLGRYPPQKIQSSHLYGQALSIGQHVVRPPLFIFLTGGVNQFNGKRTDLDFCVIMLVVG